MKKVIVMFTLGLFMGMPGALHAEGELVWQYDRVPTAGLPYSDVAVTADGVFAPYQVSWGEIRVEKRTLDNSLGWQSSVAIPVGMWANGYPHIAADSTGVYVAVSSALSSNLRQGTLSVAKLSPVSGFVLAVVHSNNSRYVNVTDVEVDGSGVYIAGGGDASSGDGRWRVEKWYKDLSGWVWGYTSMLSSGNTCDYWGPVMAANSSSLFLGGCRYDPSPGISSTRLSKVNKTTGAEEWVQLGPWGTIGIHAIAADDSNVYTAKRTAVSNGYLPWHPYLSFNSTSYLEKRPLDNNPVIWTVATNDLTTSLNIHSGAIYRTYAQNGDLLALAKMDKRKFSDGSQLGVFNLSSAVSLLTPPSAGILGVITTGSVGIDSSAIYIAGRNNAPYGFGFPYTARVEKYNHFGSVTLPAPTGLTGTPGTCGTGQINIVWDSVVGASGYDLQINGGAWLSLGNVTSYTHSGLVAGSPHTYSVRAWDINGPGTAAAAVAQNAPSVCPTCAATTMNNCVLPNALNGAAVDGSCVATHAGTCNFTCSSPNWNENSNTCVLIPNPPIITVTVTPTLVRSGERADITVEVNDPVSDLSCTVLGVDPTGTPDSTTFDHEPSVTLDPITNKAYVTKPLTSAQLVRVSCTHTTLGITTSVEKRVNVSPSVQEI